MPGHSRWIRQSIKELERIRDIPMQRSGMYRMDRNERTWSFSDSFMDEIRRRIISETLTNYPEIEDIYHKLAVYLDVDDDQIYFHSGSDLVIKSVYETYIDKGDRVLMQNPSYAMYGVYGRMYGADIYEQDFKTDLSFDTEEYCESIARITPKLVILENPSGYIGNSYTHEQVEQVIKTAWESGSLVLVDEAYIDYISEASVQDLISDYDNLIIVRTFSKAWGLAGMRVGYAVSNELLISEIFRVMPMHELTSATVIALDTVLDHASEMRVYIKEVEAVRKYFLHELADTGVRTVKSNTHFVTVAIGERMNTEDFRSKAHESGYFVRRPFGQDILRNWVRIGLLPMKEMRGFVSFMKEYIRDGLKYT